METQRRSGPFAPRELPHFIATMSLSDCRRRGIRRLWLPCVPCPVPTAETRLRSGSPGYLACSVIARSPQPPRASRRMLAFVASPTMAGFTILGGDSRRQQRNEAESGSLALGLATSLSGGYHPPLSATLADRHVSRALSPPHAEAQLHVERTINMCSTFQLHRTRRHSRLNPRAQARAGILIEPPRAQARAGILIEPPRVPRAPRKRKGRSLIDLIEPPRTPRAPRRKRVGGQGG